MRQKPIAHDETERRKESGADEDQKKINLLGASHLGQDISVIQTHPAN